MRTIIQNILLILVLLLMLGAPVLGQSPSETPDAAPSLSSLREKLSEVEDRLEELPKETALSLDVGGPPSSVTSLRKREASLRRHISVLEQREKLKSRLAEAQAEIRSLAQGAPLEKESYSVSDLDGLQSELESLRTSAEGHETALKAARTALSNERDEQSEREASRRRLLEQLESVKRRGDVDLQLEKQVEDATAAVQAGQAAIALGKAEVANAQESLELNSLRQELLRLRLEKIQQQVDFTQETLTSQLESLEKQRTELNTELEEIREDISLSQNKREALLEDDIPDDLQSEELAARQAWVNAHERARNLHEKALELNLVKRDLWERRYLVSQRQATAQYSAWRDAAQSLVFRLQSEKESLNADLSQVRQQLADLLDEPAEGMSSTNPWASVHAQALVAQQTAIESTLNSLGDTLALAQRLLAELTNNKKTQSLDERADEAWKSLTGFWNIELYTLGDRAVTVGKVIVAVLVLLFGLSLVGRFTHFLGEKFIGRLPVQESVKFNLERMLKYFFILLVFLFALHVVNIPLTIFTFLGGSLAIAVGFGAQNILNNFISGLILMVEKPVRVGDLIEVDNTTGFVEEIGARSTRIRIPTGIHVVLPNSVLLENQVINWTLTDQKLRAEVSVGVAYGSPTRKVVELMQSSVEALEGVHAVPAPIVIFDEFGDSSLNFTVHFWISIVSPMDKLRVQTQVRLAIDDAFRKNNITIPFPQRDLNFNKPVPVVMMEPDHEQNQDN